MPGLLPAIGEISYNGFVFSGSAETVSIEVTPVEDEAGRTVIYNRFVFTIEDVIAGRPSDALVEYARMRLTKNGGKFNYLNRGIGAIAINGGTARDVNYGPKCRSLSIKPIGGRNASKIVWSCEICVPDCTAARYQFATMSFNFKLTFDIDENGLTTRTYSGNVLIPMTRNGPADRTISDSADAYREMIVPYPLPKFKRVRQSFDLSPDKRRLDFSIVDVEMFGPAPPEGVTDWEGSHSVSSSEAGLVKWTGTIAASYNVAPGVSKDKAVKHFLDLAKDRIGFAASQLGRPPQSFILLSMSIAEPQLNGPRNASFSLSYSFISTLDKILSGSGLWRPVSGSDWKIWSASMEKIIGPRGLAQLKFNTNEDRIIDLCSPGSVSIPTGAPEVRELRNFGDMFIGNCPDKANSWVAYENGIFVEGDDGMVPLKLLPTEPLKKTFEVNLVANGALGVPRLPAAGTPPASTVSPLWNNVFSGGGVLEPTFQQRTAPMVYVYLVGRAMRACYEIPIPTLEEDVANGVYPQPANRLDRGEGFTQEIKYNSGLPIYVATWRMRYAMEKHKVDKLPIPKTPFTASRSR